MFFVHELHSLTLSEAPAYEELLRDRWVPALAREPGARLIWCARPMPGGHAVPELVTLTAVPDGEALVRLGERIRQGDLRDDARVLAAARSGTTTRVMSTLKFSGYAPDLDSPSLRGSASETSVYIHDFVPPRPGMQRPYEQAMETSFLAMLEMENLPMAIWAAFEVVPGGGQVPENLMITQIKTAAAGVELLWEGNPREAIRPGTWMFDALKLRDRWTSRLLRSVSWSPTS